MAVEARLDDVHRLAESFEVRDRGRRQEAALGVARVCLERRPAERRVRGHGESGCQFPAGIPGVDVGPRRDDHVRMTPVGQVGDHRAAGRLERQPERREAGRTRVPECRLLGLGVDRPAVQLGAVGRVCVDRAVLAGDDQLLDVVALQVGIARRRLAA